METPQGRNGRVDGPTATIVVLTFNRRHALVDCLERIWDKTTVVAEVIVVDNGSTDGTAELLREYAAAERPLFTALLLPTNEGVGARNEALRSARGEFILQVDDDVLVGPGWDTALLSPFSNPDVGAMGQEGFFINWNGLMGPHPKAFLDPRRPQIGDYCDLVMGYCWAWRHDVIRPCSGSTTQFEPEPRFLYDEAFNPHWHEETDLQLQIKAAGYRIRCGPPVATHRSLKNAAAARNNDPMIGLHHAAAHEQLLADKWGKRRQDLGLELDRRR